jgi:hypothetical protein
MGRMIPTPNERAAIKQFLHECTDLHIDAAEVTGMASGVSLTVHYRSPKGQAQHKTMSNPDARSMSDIEDMVVLMSEWLVHPSTRAGELLNGEMVH